MFYFVSEKPHRNGFHGPKISQTTSQLPIEALDLKNLGNTEYEAERFSNAIEIYNRALVLCYHPILLGNRAAAFLKVRKSQKYFLFCYNKFLSMMSE